MRFTLALVGATLAACEPATPTPPPPDTSCEAQPDPHCANAIDHIVVPLLRDLGSGPRDASADVLCRRMAIDLIGRGPTAAERAQCQQKTPDQIADMFLALPEYVRTQRRAWGELFGYQSLIVWGDDIAALDAAVGRLYRNEMSYADFVRYAVVHPAFYGLHPGDSWIANVFSTFLGRTARQDEIDSARPLTAAFVGRLFCAREVWWNHYTSYLAATGDEAQATSFGNDLCYNGAKVEYAANLCKCKPSLLSAGCFSDVFGTFVRLEELCVLPDSRAPQNVMRITGDSPTLDDLCPDNVTHRPECTNRGRGETQSTFVPFVPLAPLPEAGKAQFRKIGDALVERGDLWEAAADRELRKLLGWWHATFKHPDSDLAAVRSLLADMLASGTPLRDVIKLIVTSQLYIQPATIPDGLDPATLPPWAAGPTKLLSGESWLQSAAVAVGDTVGSCDFRWGQASQFEPQWIDPRLNESTVGAIDLRMPPAPPHGYAIKAIQRLGGCTGDAKRPEISNVGLAFSQAAVARELCAVATSVAPPGWTGSLDAAARFMAANAWGRELSDAEASELVGDMQACLAAGPTGGCASPDTAVRWLCVRLLDSVAFSTY